MHITRALLVLTGLVAMIGLASARHSSWIEWQQYKQKHGKVYADKSEDVHRFSLYQAAKDKVEQHNRDSSKGHKLGLNHLADLTPAELAKMNGLKYDKAQHELRLLLSENDEFLREILDDPSEVPQSVDWRTVKGRVGAVRNQGHCGSCWAFATVGLLEGQESVRGKKELVELSEQELVDCSKDNNGCEGGIMSLALDDIHKMGGIASEKEYPYVAPDEQECKFNRSKVVFTDKGSIDLPKHNETLIKEVVAKYGPVAIGVAANDHLSQYESGVFNDPKCTDDLNHGVLLVGYGTDSTHGDYWIVKNSWGSEWGEEGYFRMKRGTGMCGIGTLATIATF